MMNKIVQIVSNAYDLIDLNVDWISNFPCLPPDKISAKNETILLYLVNKQNRSLAVLV